MSSTLHVERYTNIGHIHALIHVVTVAALTAETGPPTGIHSELYIPESI